MTDLLAEYVGKAVIVTTVGRIYVGKLTGYDPSHLRLEEASWVADQGRVTESLRTGSLNEVEPYPKPMLVQRGVITDLTEWDHGLPREPK